MKSLLVLLLTAVACIAQGFSDASAPFMMSISPVRRGLVGYWSLDEASGTRYDKSSSGVNLTASGAVTQQSGLSVFTINCADFVGASAQDLHAASSNSFNFQCTQPFAVFGWARFTNSATDQALCGHYDSTVGGHGWAVSTFGGKLLFQIEQDATHRIYLIGTQNLTNSTWHSIAVTYDGSKTTNGMHMYVNNVAETPTSGAQFAGITDTTSAAVFAIGKRGITTASFPANGLIDEVHIWNIVPDSSVFTILYHTGLGTHFPWAHP